MPGYRSLGILRESLGEISGSAVDYINTRRQEKQKEEQMNILKSYLGNKFNPQPTAKAPAQPSTGSGPTPQAPDTLNAGASVSSPDVISPEVEMLAKMGLTAPDIYKQVMARHTPNFVQEKGYRGELNQFGRNPETGALDPQSKQELVPGAPVQPKEPPAPSLEFLPPQDPAQKPERRTNGSRIEERWPEIDKRTGKPTGQWTWKEVGTNPMPGMAGYKSYDALNKQQKGMVDRIGTYGYDPKLLQGYRGSDKNEIMAAVLEKYPNYNSMEYPIRAKAASDFRSPNGVAGRNVTALNTAIGHMGDLSKAMAGLQNAEIPLWNTIKNKGLTATGDPRVVKFMTAANAVEGEVSKVFAGKAGTDQEINEWRNSLNAAQSPEQLKGAIQTMAHLLNSRIATLNWQAEQNVGTKIPMLSDRSRQTLKGIGINPDEFENTTETKHSRTPGDIEEGDGGKRFRFKGGNERDNKNWEEVK